MDEPEGGERKDSAQASAPGLLVSTDSPSLVLDGKTLVFGFGFVHDFKQ